MTPAPADQAVRDRVVRDFDTTFLLEAGAGTGKTTVLVSRILALVRTGRATLDRIVAITFTEKAAGELKLRLREGIEDALERTPQEDERQRLLAAATDLERAPVSTIHAFAAALLRERPFEAGLDPGFQVAAEIAGERVLDDAWDAWFDQSMAAGRPHAAPRPHPRPEDQRPEDGRRPHGPRARRPGQPADAAALRRHVPEADESARRDRHAAAPQGHAARTPTTTPTSRSSASRPSKPAPTAPTASPSSAC